jgi:hypothetical protein
MRLIIEARLEGNDIEPTVVPIPLAVIDRYDDDLGQLGLSLAEGRELLALTACTGLAARAYRCSSKRAPRASKRCRVYWRRSSRA